jgi:hypothetical protein
MISVAYLGNDEITYIISHKWPIILHFHCCFNNKYTPYFLV